MSSSTLKSSSSSSKRSLAALAANNVEAIVQQALDRAGLGNDRSASRTTTKAGWCLRQGLMHLATQNDGLARRIAQHGVPTFYACCKNTNDNKGSACGHQATQDLKDPSTSFESLCRIIVGQFISGQAARAAWRKVLTLRGDMEDPNTSPLTPAMVLDRTGLDGSRVLDLQQSLGLTKNKAKSLYDLALHFHDGRLSEEFFRPTSVGSDRDKDEHTAAIRNALLQVRGIGEWSCDMFLLFTLEHADVLPLGDLGVRKGIAQHFWGAPFKSKKLTLCPKKDATKIHAQLDAFRPYRSLVTYYMYRVADTPEAVVPEDDASFDTAEPEPKHNAKGKRKQQATPIAAPAPATPSSKRRRRSSSSTRVVTP